MIRIRDNKLTTIFITVIILFSMALSGCLFNNTSAYTYYLVDIGDTDEAMTKYGNQYSDYKFIWDDSGYLYELQQSMVAKDVLIGINPITGEDKVIYDTQNNKTRIVGLRNDALFILKGKKIFECKINDIDDLNNIQISSKKKEILTLPKPNRGVDNLEPTFCFDWEGDCLYLIDDTDILDVKIYSYEYDENQEVK
ncbi:MAG: hypothetical protein SPL99_06450 [Catonella sp.]|nr:hypothetical protein [Catonella sp.]